MAKQSPQDKRKQRLIDELLTDYDGPESFWGESGIFAQLKKRIVECALDAEMDEHLGYGKHDPKGNNSGNSRNGRQRNRGVKDIFIACVDGLKGFPEAIEAVFPQTQVQLCIVHMVRNSVRFVNWKDRKELCGDLKEIWFLAQICATLNANHNVFFMGAWPPNPQDFAL